jgi:hypothetical protein
MERFHKLIQFLHDRAGRVSHSKQCDVRIFVNLPMHFQRVTSAPLIQVRDAASAHMNRRRRGRSRRLCQVDLEWKQYDRSFSRHFLQKFAQPIRAGRIRSTKGVFVRDGNVHFDSVQRNFSVPSGQRDFSYPVNLASDYQFAGHKSSCRLPRISLAGAGENTSRPASYGFNHSNRHKFLPTPTVPSAGMVTSDPSYGSQSVARNRPRFSSRIS